MTRSAVSSYLRTVTDILFIVVIVYIIFYELFLSNLNNSFIIVHLIVSENDFGGSVSCQE